MGSRAAVAAAVAVAVADTFGPVRRGPAPGCAGPPVPGREGASCNSCRHFPGARRRGVGRRGGGPRPRRPGGGRCPRGAFPSWAQRSGTRKVAWARRRVLGCLWPGEGTGGSPRRDRCDDGMWVGRWVYSAEGLFNTLLGVAPPSHPLLGFHPCAFHQLGLRVRPGGEGIAGDGEAQEIPRITYQRPVKVRLATFCSFLRLRGLLGLYSLLPELVLLWLGTLEER